MLGFRISLALVAATAVASSAGAGTASVASRAAQCFGPQRVLHGGVYRTACFVPGLRVTVPARWQIGEDSKLELKLLPPHSRNPDTPALRFWLDPHASTACTDVPVHADLSTPAAAIAWLRGNKNLVVSASHRATVGRKKIPARYVDLDNSPHAPRCSPTCPGPCIDYFLFHAPGTATEPYGTGRGEPVRLYFAEVRSPRHLFVFGVDAPSPTRFARLTPVAAKILGTLRLPSRLPSRRGR
jgi:hypothetical protein